MRFGSSYRWVDAGLVGSCRCQTAFGWRWYTPFLFWYSTIVADGRRCNRMKTVSALFIILSLLCALGEVTSVCF